MRDYFNLLDTPVYKFNGTFKNTVDNEMSISFNSGLDHTARFLIFNVYIYTQQFFTSTSFNVSADLRFINNQVYQQLIVNETFNDINDFVQLPNTPRGTGSASSHVNFHPTTQNMYLVMNGDQFTINFTNMEVNQTVNVSLLAYTRTRVPNIDVGGGTLSSINYNNIG